MERITVIDQSGAKVKVERPAGSEAEALKALTRGGCSPTLADRALAVLMTSPPDEVSLSQPIVRGLFSQPKALQYVLNYGRKFIQRLSPIQGITRLSLNKVFINYNAISFGMLVEKLPSLEEVDFGECSCCYAGLGNADVMQTLFQKCSTIEQLKMSTFAQEAVLWRVQESYRTLRVLSLAGCGNKLAGNFERAAQKCTRLKSLDLTGCKGIDEEWLLRSIPHLTQLRHLSLEGCQHLKNINIILGKLAQHCPELRSLNLGSVHEVSDSGVIALAKGCAKISELRLMNCFQVGDSAVLEVTKRCSSLTMLTLSNCKVSDEGIHSIAVHCSQLAHLELLGCETVTIKAVRQLMNNCPALKKAFLGRTGDFEIVGKSTSDNELDHLRSELRRAEAARQKKVETGSTSTESSTAEEGEG